MNRELARHVVMAGFHSASVLQDLLPMLKTHCDNNEYNQYLKAISSVSVELTLEIFNKIFAEYPDLKEEVDAKILKYGKFI
jgi:hypothetical protein